jgi:hypothetical protein
MGSLSLVGFYDIETEGWDTFVSGGYYDGDTYQEFWSEDDFANHLLSLEGDIWAWNGGLYDAVWFADYLDRRNIPFACHFAGGRIIKLKGGKLVLRDAAALIPMTLAKAAQIAGREISKDTGLACKCGLRCGGYCRIRRLMPIEDRLTLSRYLREDCETGYEIVRALFEHAKEHDYVLTSTVGGSAWATAKARIPEIGNAFWEKSRDYYVARDGYYGGRVFVGALSAESGHRYDINSAYPAALSTVALPHGQYAVVTEEVVECFKRRRPGIYHAEVYVPTDMLIPPLPTRTPSGRVCFNVGKVRGAWALNELEYALSIGCKLVTLFKAIVWSDSTVIFKELMEDFYRVRAKYGKKHALGVWQKWLANSLTGKFAMRPERYQLHAHPSPMDIRACDPFNPAIAALGCLIGACSGKCHAWEPIGRGNIWVERVFRLADCSHVQWSAYLTAQTRITWHKAAMLAGPENVLYGDTDSIYLRNRGIDKLVGDELGSWAYEGELHDWECLAPKTYSYQDGYKRYDVPQRHVRGKGLPHIDPATYDRFRAGEAVETDRGVYGLRTTSRRDMDKLFVRKRIRRKRHARDRIDGVEFVADRGIGGDGCATYPITYYQQLRRERGESKCDAAN